MIYAAFTYFNEDDMLELYIESTKCFVDRYIIVEGDLTFQGNPKTQNFKMPENIEPDRIRYEFMSLPQVADTWERERVQRNRLGEIYAEERKVANADFLSSLGLYDQDWIILSDVDEIPNVEALKELSRKDVSCWALDMDLFNYKYNLKISSNWRLAKYVGGRTFASVGSDTIRLTKSPFIIENAGWHFSNVMSPERYILKHKSISHLEANRPDLLKLEIVSEAMDTQKDLFNLGKDCFDPVVVGINNLPKFIQDNPEKFSDFLFKGEEHDHI